MSNSREWKRAKKYWVLAACLMIGATLWSAKQRYAFGLNLTESLPNWGFVVDGHQLPQKGELALFLPPENPFYDKPFVKRVVGVEGDLVEIRNGVFFVGEYEVGTAKPYSKSGLKMQPAMTGIIPEGYVFVAGDHIDSFDSRYALIGLVPMTNVLGRAFPIL